MGRAGKLVLAAIGGGLALTLALVAAVDPPMPGAPASSNPEAGAQPKVSDNLGRCRTITQADAECTAAWEAKRRHFFGSDKDAS